MTPHDAPTQRPVAIAAEEVVADFLRRRAAGEQVDAAAFIRAHPQLTPELQVQFDRLARIDAARAQAAVDEIASAETIILRAPAETPAVICPFCRHATALPKDQRDNEVLCPSCSQPFHVAQQDEGPPRTCVAQYELLDVLGRGSFGTVWRARDGHLDRLVALKLPRQDRLEIVRNDDFLREARVAAQLRHPNIVAVHEVDEAGDVVYIASELVDGLSLSEWAKRERPDARAVAALCIQIARALDYAHEEGVVHRDLKPANVLIDAAGAPHITDFGLAKCELEDFTLTADDQVLGTPAYMPPEQARGESSRVDRRGDVYSLGVILFELLTGELPFRGHPHALIMHVIQSEPPRPTALDERVPAELETICLKCLEKDPARRYATTRDLADELQRWLDGEAILARPVGRLGRAWRWSRRHPWLAGGAAAVAATLLTVTAAAVAIAVDRHALVQQLLAQHSLPAELRSGPVHAALAEAARHDDWSTMLTADDQAALEAALHALFDKADQATRQLDADAAVSSCFVVDGRGVLRGVWPTSETVRGTDFSERMYFQRAKQLSPGETVVGDWYRSHRDDRYKAPLSTPIRSGGQVDSPLVGVLAVSLSTGVTDALAMQDTMFRDVLFWTAVAVAPIGAFAGAACVVAVRRAVART